MAQLPTASALERQRIFVLWFSATPPIQYNPPRSWPPTTLREADHPCAAENIAPKGRVSL